MSSKSLEEYLKSNTESFGEHILKATIHGDGKVTFYIHPYNKNGETIDFIVEENNLQKAILMNFNSKE